MTTDQESRQQTNSRTRSLALIVLVSAIVGSITGLATVLVADEVMGDEDGGSDAQETRTPTEVSTGDGPEAPGVADLYEELRPSIVRITAASTSTGQSGTGSGVVIDDEGHIVTNYHVVANLDRLDVRFASGDAFPAELVGSDPGNDLAILRIEDPPDDLAPATLGDSSDIRVGHSTIAIGNPFDLEATLTMGVVSGLERVLSGANARPMREIIQTDTTINPGNSGGGLFNLNGELIGITNALENPSGQEVFVGIGYAIPVDTLARNLDAMIDGETIRHARLGITLQEITPAIADAFDLPVDRGILVGSVEQGSGAGEAGLRPSSSNAPGDIIVAIDDNEVATFDDLASYLDTREPGDEVTLDVVRDGAEETLTVILDAWTS